MTDHGYLYELLDELGLSPSQADTIASLIGPPVKLALLVLAGVVLARVGARLARRFVRALHDRAPLRTTSVRAEQRAKTLGDVLDGLVRTVVWAVVVLLVLGELGVNVAPLLAGAGIAGIAIGFGAQSLVKDFFTGFFILVEDQYGVGDVIVLGDATGTVEDVTMRVTRLRATDGTVWFVPNGEIKQVGNTSMEWSRALIDVLVPYETDVRAVTGYLKDLSTSFAADEAWSDAVLEPPEVWGVQSMGADGITVRMVVKTAPRRQYDVARELRARITDRLRREGVRGPGQTVLVTAGALDAGTPPPPPPEPDAEEEAAAKEASSPE
jgi:small-conductance mechanosensitive channel